MPQANGAIRSTTPLTASSPQVTIKEFPVNDTLIGGITIGTAGSDEFVFANGQGGFERLAASGHVTRIPFPTGPVPAGFTGPFVPASEAIGVGPNNLIVAGAQFGQGSNSCCPSIIAVPVTGNTAMRVTPDSLINSDQFVEPIFAGFANAPNNTFWFAINAPQTTAFGCLTVVKGGDFQDEQQDCGASGSPSADNTIAAVVLGTDNMIWVGSNGDVNNGVNPSIFVVNPATGALVKSFPLPVMSQITAMVTNKADNAIWFTDAGQNEIGRISPTGQLKFFHIPTANAGLAGITTDPNFPTVFWFTENTANKVGRITTDGITFDQAVPTANAGLGQMATASAGAIFFTETHAIGKIAR